jgi:transcriptional regulator with XRE-family HTH domain
MKIEYFIITSMNTVTLKKIVPRLGRFLKLFREKTGRNQGDVALQAGISISMLSQIERGTVSPSIDTLMMVCTVLGLDPADLFKMLSTDRPVRVHHQGERLTMENSGVRYEQLMTSSQGAYQVELFLLEVDPGCQTMLSSEGHDGIEIGYVLEGCAILRVDNSDYQLREGDSMHLNSHLPHQLCNSGQKKFKAVWSISPPHVDYFSIHADV